MAKILSVRDMALAPLSGFRTKKADVPEWNGITVVLREPSAKAWAKWRELVGPQTDDGKEATTSTMAEQAHRNLMGDVVLFIDTLLDLDNQPVFTSEDTEQVAAIYGPVHARLLKQALDLGMTQSDAGKK